MTWLLGLPRWVHILVALAAVFASVWWLRADAYKDGRRYERGVIERQIAADKAAQAERERQADASLQFQKAKDAIAADERKAEIDEATKGIPDQGLTDRQRVRACLSLRAEAKANGRDQPTCEPAKPR